MLQKGATRGKLFRRDWDDAIYWFRSEKLLAGRGFFVPVEERRS